MFVSGRGAPNFLPSPDIALAEQRVWGELYATAGALTLLDVPPPMDAALQSGAKQIDIPPVVVTLASAAESPTVSVDAGMPATVVATFDEHRRQAPGRFYVFLNPENSQPPEDKFQAALDLLLPAVRDWLPAMQVSRAVHQANTATHVTLATTQLGASGYLMGEILWRGEVRLIEWIGTAAIAITGIVGARKDAARRMRELQASMPAVKRAAYQLAELIKIDLPDQDALRRACPPLSDR